MRRLLTIGDLDRAQIEAMMDAALRRSRPACDARRGAVVALAFYEPSLRTRVGFEAAAARLGASAVSVTEPKQSPQMAVPESLEDTVRCLDPYCDVLCLRHPDPRAPERVARLVEVPVVNCGNGTDEHPVQALVDLLALRELCGAVDGTRVAIVGDLRHMRAAHSLLLALARFEDVHVRCISPPALGMPERYANAFRAAGNTLAATDAPDFGEVEVVYVAGLPQTRENGVSRADQDRFRVDAATLGRLAPHARILCPLPRVDEIAPEVDASPHAAYFRQSAYGLAMRTALLDWALDGWDVVRPDGA
jgi:aspartate carbamoyltransferase catalytic subunit